MARKILNILGKRLRRRKESPEALWLRIFANGYAQRSRLDRRLQAFVDAAKLAHLVAQHLGIQDRRLQERIASTCQLALLMRLVPEDFLGRLLP